MLGDGYKEEFTQVGNMFIRGQKTDEYFQGEAKNARKYLAEVHLQNYFLN